MLHILLAEDNLGDVFLVRRALKEHHVPHELHLVRDGAEALEFVNSMGRSRQSPCPDLVLLDVNLPKVDGPNVLSAFRKHPECAQTPVIVVTSSDAPRDRARLANLGISRYFRKPSDYREFLALGAIVREVLEASMTSNAFAMHS
jgi:CheY-like chemotaxis protein